jgi:hypothetical protein
MSQSRNFSGILFPDGLNQDPADQPGSENPGRIPGGLGRLELIGSPEFGWIFREVGLSCVSRRV